MSFGDKFGQLVRRKRGIEGLTQQSVAVRAFGDERYKSRISELENGKIAKPWPRTIDALVVALNIHDDELTELLRTEPHPRYLDNLLDFFQPSAGQHLDLEISIKKGGIAVFVFSGRMLASILRVEFFVEERILIWVTDEQKRRPLGLPLTASLSQELKECHEIHFVHALPAHPGYKDIQEIGAYPLKVIS